MSYHDHIISYNIISYHVILCIYMLLCVYMYISLYIYIYIDIDVHMVCMHVMIRSVFKMPCLFLRPRPWQFEIWDSTDKAATYLLLGFETLNLEFCDLKLWKLNVCCPSRRREAPQAPGGAGARRAPPGTGHQSELSLSLSIYIYVYIYIYICTHIYIHYIYTHTCI